MNNVVKISFASYETMPFGTWCDWGVSSKNALQFFTGFEVEDLEKIHPYDLHVLSHWLSCLNDTPELPEVERNIWEKSLRQKLDAIKYFKKFKDSIYLVLPYLLAIFEQEEYDANDVEYFAQRCRQETFENAYPIALAWLKQLEMYEQFLQNKLKPLEVTKEQKVAGIDDLKGWSDYSL